MTETELVSRGLRELIRFLVTTDDTEAAIALAVIVVRAVPPHLVRPAHGEAVWEILDALARPPDGHESPELLAELHRVERLFRPDDDTD